MTLAVALDVDDRFWLHLPKRFPTEDGFGRSEWEKVVVDKMRPTWGSQMTPDMEGLVAQALRFGLSKVHQDDAVTLQFWPTTSIANAVVHIIAGEGDIRDDQPSAPLSSQFPYMTRPTVTAFDTESLGRGLEARYARSFDVSGRRVAMAGVNYEFRSQSGFIGIMLEATFPALTSVALEPLRRLVEGIRVVPADGNGEWIPSDMSVPNLSPGEEWDLAGE